MHKGPTSIVVKVATLAIASHAMNGVALPIEPSLIQSLHRFATHMPKICILYAKHKPTMKNSLFSMQSDLGQCLGTILNSVLIN